MAHLIYRESISDGFYSFALEVHPLGNALRITCNDGTNAGITMALAPTDLEVLKELLDTHGTNA